MNHSESSDAWVRAMPAVFVLIWSTGFIVARFGMPNAPPFSFLGLRYALSIACFVIWIRMAKVKWPQSRSEWFHLSVTGVLMHAGYLGGVWAAVKAGMGSGLSALIVGLQPVLTAIWLSSRDTTLENKVSRRQWLGLLLGFCGLLLVVWHKLTQGSALDHVNALNLSFAIMALLSITLGTLYQKSFVKPCDVEFIGAMAWSVLGLTLGGSSLLYMLIQKGAAASVTSLMYLVPPCTALVAWLLFDEPITAFTLVGIALTAWGVSWVVRPSQSFLGEKT